MRLSFESRRMRWSILAATWLLIAAMLYLHTCGARDYLATAGRAGLRGAAPPTTPLQQPFFSFESDAQTWIEHAIALTEGHDVQLRYTTIDNAPDGREVHWNSAWAWTIAGAGRIRQGFTHEPRPLAIERAAIWLNAIVLFALIVAISSWTARWAGVSAGALVALGMVGHAQFYEGFFPNYVDHHGLLSTAVLGMMLGALAMGGGWWRAPGPASLLPASPQAARRGAIFSAVSGALGMWISAASLVPPIAIIGSSALAIVLLQGRRLQQGGATFDPAVWRLWGRLGAGLSVFFYLLEYAPYHLGLRLEANHPLYALAWLGGAELVAQGAERWLAPPAARWARARRLILPLLAVAGVPLTIALGGPAVFILGDPFQARLPHYVLEGLTLFERIRRSGWMEAVGVLQLTNVPLVFALVLLCWRRPGGERTLLWFCFLATLAFTAMGWWQTRWLLNASGPQICLALVAVATWSAGRRPAVAGLAALATVGLIYLPPAIKQIATMRRLVGLNAVSQGEALQPLFRDVAATLRASQPTGDIVLLSSPNSSTGIGYFGRFKTIGTLYWENLAGLKATAEIFSAQSDREAAVLLRARRITHIAMISEENFLSQYFELLHPAGTRADFKKSFGYGLLVEKKIPVWLQIIPYQVPADLKGLNVTVLLFKVAFYQTAPQAIYNLGLAKIALGDAAGAEKDFVTVTQLAPTVAEPWLRLGELLVERKAWGAAVDAFVNGITRAPAGDRPRLYSMGGDSFIANGAVSAAIRMYRECLALEFNATIASNLAWLRATASDAALRNGDEALTLAMQAVRTNQNSPVYLNSLAAALAEKGRYAEAVEAATHAVVAARTLGDTAVASQTERRLAAYRSNRPWRE